MKQTTIMLPLDLKMKAIEYAHTKHISLGELIREILDQILNSKKKYNTKDVFFSDRVVFSGRAPKDSAKKHDDYIYGEDT
jgi:hypothetical protein